MNFLYHSPDFQMTGRTCPSKEVLVSKWRLLLAVVVVVVVVVKV